MGCDIHIVVEQRYEDKWVGITNSDAVPYDAFNPNPSARDYRFFGALAGVRTNGPKPKGMPEDASDLAWLLAEGWDVDGHSHSYMSLKDFISTWLAVHDEKLPIIVKEKLERGTYSVEYDKLIRELSMHVCWGHESEKIDDTRVVFWFDN